MVNLNPPRIEGIDNTVRIGTSIAVSRFFNVSDPDGDEIVRYSFLDDDRSADSGYLTFNGSRLQAGVYHTIDAEDLANLRYHAGTKVGTDKLRFRAFDGKFNSNLGVATTISVAPNTTAPIMTAKNFNRVANEFQKVSKIFSAHDPDGWPLTRYRFRDKNSAQKSGYFVLANVRMPSNQWFSINASQLKDLFYYTGDVRSQENLLGQVFDGQKWSNTARAHFFTRPNKNAPVVQAKYIAKGARETFGIQELFDIQDQDGNSVKTYEFRDPSVVAASGFVAIDGVRQTADTWIRVAAKDIHKVTYTTSATNRLNSLKIRVNDGKFPSQTSIGYVAVTSQPVIGTKPPLVYDGDQIINLVSIIDQSDDGPRNIRYRIYDASTGSSSARFELNGVFLNPRVTYTFDASRMNDVFLYTGDFNERRLDHIYVQTFNGNRWSDWRDLKVWTEPHMLDALANVEDTVVNNRNSWRLWLNGNANQRQEITFSFRETATPGIDLFTQRLTTGERARVREILARLETILDIDFIEVPDSYDDPRTGDTGGVIRIGHGGGDQAFHPDEISVNTYGGEIYIADAHIPEQLTPGTASYTAFLNLLGQSLGLRPSASTRQYFDPLLAKFPLPPDTDDMRNTVMSANYNPDNVDGFMGPVIPVEPLRFGIYDMFALRNLYGFSGSGYAGNTVYGTTGNNQDINDWTAKVSNLDGTEFHDRAFQTAITGDSGGIDTIDVSGMLVSTVIDLTPGSYSSIGETTADFITFRRARNNVAIGHRTIIENVIGGSSSELIRGNFADNHLRGGAGNDILIGAGGDDILEGNSGNDTYRWKLTDQNETIRENGGGGIDVLDIRSHWGLDNFGNDLLFSRSGRDLVINLAFNRGESQGRIRIENMAHGLSRVETLRLNYVNGNSFNVDLRSIFNSASTDEQRLVLTSDRTTFGIVAAAS